VLFRSLSALAPLYGERLIVASPAAAARPRPATARRAYRERRWRQYFRHAVLAPVATDGLAVWPGPTPLPGRLVGLDGADGFCRQVGVVATWDGAAATLHLPAPLPPGAVRRLRFGHLLLDPATGVEQR
jgi:hypothetical protein